MGRNVLSGGKTTIAGHKSFYSLSIRIDHSILLLLFSLFPLFLTSCIEGEEEIWVNEDASGRARFQVTAPTLLFSKFGGAEQIIADAKAGATSSDNIAITSLEATKSGSKTTFRAEVTFEDARQLNHFLKTFRDPPDSPNKCEEEILFGEPALSIGFPDLSFSREIDIRSLVPAESNNPFALRMLGDSQINYRLHLPTPAKTHNATRTSNDGKTLEWDFPLGEMIAGPVEMNFTAPLPRLSLYLTLAGVLLFLMVFGFLIFLKKRGRPLTNQS